MKVLPFKIVSSQSLIFVFTAALILASGSALASTQPYISSHQVNFGTGNKYLTATDMRLAGPGPRADTDVEPLSLIGAVEISRPLEGLLQSWCPPTTDAADGASADVLLLPDRLLFDR